MALCALPRFIVLKSQGNDKYLIHLRDDQDYLQFSGTDFASLHVKFEVVRSSTVDGLVHLKCCYNNKYWVCRQNQHWITAEAREMEEDQTKWSCTLFKPEFFTSNRIRLYHVHIKTNLMFQDAKPHYLGVGKASNEADYLDFFDWESLPILPRYIVLKGDNGNYLACTDPKISTVRKILICTSLGVSVTTSLGVGLMTIPLGVPLIPPIISLIPPNQKVYLRFNCKDKGDQTVGNEVFTTPDGNIRLKSNHTGKFWSRSPNWMSSSLNFICPDSEDNTNNNSDTLFKVIKVSHNKIALKNLGNNKFCMSLTTDGKNDCLNANSSTIPETAKFLVEELVEKRKIYSVCFHEKDARTYEKEISHEVKSTDINQTEVAQQATLEFEYTKEESQTWTTSNSLKQTVETEITVGTPKVVKGKLKYAHVATTTVKDGKTLATKRVEKYTRNVNVPPMSKVVANFRVTQALCDVPYSYSQTETLTDGTIVTYNRDDGLYTYVHTEVSFHVKQENTSS